MTATHPQAMYDAPNSTWRFLSQLINDYYESKFYGSFVLNGCESKLKYL